MNTLEEKNIEYQLQRNQCNTVINLILYYCVYENTTITMLELPGDEVNTTDALSTGSVY